MSDLIVERQAAGLCASCGEKATTTIVLRDRRTLVCLRHFNHWQRPHISLDEHATRLAAAEARAEAAERKVAAVLALADKWEAGDQWGHAYGADLRAALDTAADPDTPTPDRWARG